jgi:thioredoxin reductase (NADPH)
MLQTIENHKVVIIGSGPAGYTAAVYAGRADLNPVVYTGIQPGGQLMITTEVENYPGFPNGVTGPEMMQLFQKQAERFGTKVNFGMVTDIDVESYPFVLTIDEDKKITAESVIVSTGASAKWLGIPSEERLNGHGVSACAVCDGFFYKGRTVAVVGAGDTACEEASYLAKLCPKVYMLVRKSEMRASKVMQDRVLNNPKIEVLWNTETDEILGDQVVEGVRVRNNITGETKELAIEGFFVAIGHVPNTEIFKGKLDMDANGYLITKPGSTYTNIEGIFACGDAQDHVYRQAVTAAGTGCMAALDAERWLAAKEAEAHQVTA